MERQRLGDVPVIVGGVIPREDFAALQALGVHGIFGPGANVGDIVRLIEDNLNTPEG
jgi:methylmalonyl-CoA mutase cobalamin-binding domain/chain